MDGTMSRRIRAGRAPLWTLAGLTFLSGCGGTDVDVSNATAIGLHGPAGSRGDSAAGVLAPRHTLDAAVVPAWYEFAPPPLPLLAPADGDDSPPPAAQGEPTVVLPSLDTDGVTRLPPDELEDAPEPPPTRYDVGGHYALDTADSTPKSAAESAVADAANNAVERLPNVAAPAAEYSAPRLVAPVVVEPTPTQPSVEAVRPLPPVERETPTSGPAAAGQYGRYSPDAFGRDTQPRAPAPRADETPIYVAPPQREVEPLNPPAAEPPRAHESVRRLTSVDDAVSAGPLEAATPDVHLPDARQSADNERRYQRPSEVFAEEAQPVSRFERLPPVEVATPRVEPTPSPTLTSPTLTSPTLTSPTLTSPSYTSPTYASPTYASPTPAAPPAYQAGKFLPPPIVFPPADAIPGVDRAPLVVARPPRLREMDLINERAGQNVRVGYELAHRGALYSAQSEFASALRTIAQALDAQAATTRHVEALVDGLAALDESDDFLNDARSATAAIDVATVVAKHRTPVLKDAPPEDLTPITALQRYYTYAQEQLAAAVEHEPAASNALYGMGKIQTTLQAAGAGSLADGPKAIALHQAALLVDDRNYMAANELGVLMARCGRYDAARAALAHSVSIAPQPAVWRNLAAVHERLGETTLAANARAAADNVARNVAQTLSAAPGPQQPVVWLEPMAFAQSAQPQSDLQRGQPAATPVPAPQTPQTSDKKTGFRWPLW
jgi:tetratricopeptide (TPR) repeat protein